MKTLELFCGTKSFSKIAKELNYKTFTIDNDEQFKPDLNLNLLKEKENWKLWYAINEAEIVWMSPPCTTFSMASGNTHWDINRNPKTKEAIEAKDLILFCKTIAEYCIKTKKIFFIENPRARARWFLPKEWRKEVWYCQYGDKRAKPTDIWTNLKNWNSKKCKNGNPLCNHERAPRGSKTGTQGLKNSKERGVIPPLLFNEIFEVINDNNC